MLKYSKIVVSQPSENTSYSPKRLFYKRTLGKSHLGAVVNYELIRLVGSDYYHFHIHIDVLLNDANGINLAYRQEVAAKLRYFRRIVREQVVLVAVKSGDTYWLSK